MENRDRELRRARAAYVGAAGRFRAALREFDGSNVPLDPGPDPANPYPWAREDIRIVVNFWAAVDRLIETRRDWDGLRRPRPYPH